MVLSALMDLGHKLQSSLSSRPNEVSVEIYSESARSRSLDSARDANRSDERIANYQPGLILIIRLSLIDRIIALRISLWIPILFGDGSASDAGVSSPIILSHHDMIGRCGSPGMG